MASAVTSQKIASKEAINTYYHSPGSTSATYLTRDSGTTQHWLDMEMFENFLAQAANFALTGTGLTELDIYAAPAANSTNAQLIVASGALTGAAIENGASVECTAAQIREVGSAAGYNLRYVSVKITVNNSSDTLGVTFVRSGCKDPNANLTPATF